MPLLTAGLVLSACGETPRPATQPRVTLKLAAPDDGGSTRDERIEIRGTVTPGDVERAVGGEDAEVSGGEFGAEVELQPGGNVIDVAATATGRRPATDAVRVERDMRVPVPELVGQEVDPAHRRRSKAAGLKPVEERAAAGSIACSAARSRSARSTRPPGRSSRSARAWSCRPRVSASR